MSFFSNLFKRKRGGTFVGNMIRRVASSKTYGILGSGRGLRNWEARQENRNGRARQVGTRTYDTNF